jgi:hypothetical protein
MARAKVHAGMGLVTMLIVLVVVVALLPMAVRLVLRSVSGFEDGAADAAVPSTANVPSMAGRKNYADVDEIPDPNTNYLCRSPNLSGEPCPEGTFCDGTASPQVCRRKTSSMSVENVTGLLDGLMRF